MRRLRGTMVRAGIGLGRAALFRNAALPPAPPPRLAAALQRDPTGSTIERVDVVLIASDYAEAAALVLPWARVTGIAAERGSADAVLLPVPTVVGLDGLLASIDGEPLVLVDADRGIVMVEPDAGTVAAFQAARQQIGPRRRLYLEYAHQPARTLDGRETRVLAAVMTLEAARQAVDNGADGLYLPEGGDLAALCGCHADAAGVLSELADVASGKPLTLAGDAGSVDVSALLRAAARMDVALAAPIDAGPEDVRMLHAYVDEVGQELLADATEYGDLRIAGRVAMGQPLRIELAEYAVDRLVVDVPGEDPAALAASAPWLDDLAGQASSLLVPVEVVLPSPDEPNTQTALALGAAGLIVPPTAVQQVKDTVRRTDAGAARDALATGG